MKPLHKQIIRNILAAFIMLCAISACTLSERDTSSESAQTQRVVPQKSVEEMYEEKRREAVGKTIDIYDQILDNN